MECEGLVARPVFKTGLRSRRGRGGSIPPHSAWKLLAVSFWLLVNSGDQQRCLCGVGPVFIQMQRANG